MSETRSQNNPQTTLKSSGKVTVLNPACSSAMVPRIPLAPRRFSSLEGKTVYLVDIGWGGPSAAYDIFQVMQDWFARNIPGVKTVLTRKKGSFMDDDPELAKEIKAGGDACILGISC
ncbi:MAG: hypothetical protein JXA46_03950 [Dehalococcoidales bacterium]|nr:hypothetical protein [Dehalococcoidales bacterium]